MKAVLCITAVLSILLISSRAQSGDADDNECQAGTHNCDENASCFSVPDGFTCFCNAGFQGDGLICKDVDECSTGIASCHPDAKCINTPGSYQCSCKPGYFGNGDVCIDTDECKWKNHNCHSDAVCLNAPGGFTCSCKSGFQGNGQRCTDIDECKTGAATCDLNAGCVNTEGGYKCSCNVGFVAVGRSCTDLDECSMGTHRCDTNAACVNTVGSYTCKCNDGLTGDGFMCNGSGYDVSRGRLHVTSPVVPLNEGSGSNEIVTRNRPGATSSVASLNEGSGDGDVTRKRPEHEKTTSKPYIHYKKTRCTCYLKAFHPESRRPVRLPVHALTPINQKEENTIYFRTPKSKSCFDIQKQCNEHCKQLAQKYFPGLNAHLSDSYRKYQSLGDLVCSRVRRYDSITVGVESMTSCTQKDVFTSAHRYADSFTIDEKLCCIRYRLSPYKAVKCDQMNTNPDDVFG